MQNEIKAGVETHGIAAILAELRAIGETHRSNAKTCSPVAAPIAERAARDCESACLAIKLGCFDIGCFEGIPTSQTVQIVTAIRRLSR